MDRAIIYILFLGSGITALIYQVLWTRLLTLTFGVTTLAVSTVLTCFFGGLALGSFLGGRFADKYGDGIRWYGVCELVIGVYALFFLLLLDANNGVYVYLARAITPGFYGLSIIKFLLAAVLLIVPTTMMGATLPLLSKTLARRYDSFAHDIGNLYAVNTAGAVGGAVLTAFVLIPVYGVSSVIYVVGCVNIIMGIVAIFISKGSKAEAFPRVTGGRAESVEDVEALPAGFLKLIIIGFALSGFTALAYEVIWTRVLGLVLVGTVYAFAAVLAAFLTGIAVGSFFISRIIDRFKNISSVIKLFALVEVLIGVSSTLLIIAYLKLPEYGLFGLVTSTTDFGKFVYLNFMVSFLLLIVPTFLFGATFPLVCKIYSRRMDAVGEEIGNLYSLNTVGGILGSFLGGFVLIEFLGMQTSLLLMGIINVAIGVFFFISDPLSVGAKKYVYAACSVIAIIIVIAVAPKNMPKELHRAILRAGESLVFYDEGPAATVMVAERENRELEFSNKRLWVNGNMATAAYYEGLQINRFQGVLPMVLHPDPKDVLVICFGSGTTFGTLSQFDVTGVDNVEISKTVISAAGYFKSENRDVLNNPVSNIIIDDGRSYLEAATKKYDVITEEPMHPSLAGVVNLYTSEYYELAKAHLKEGGIMSQWIPLYNLSVDDLKMLVRTFHEAFPYMTVWIANADIFMIGSLEYLPIDYDRLTERLAKPNIKRLLTEIDLEDPAEFLSTYIMDERATAKYVEGAPLVTDNNPRVEFTGPKSLAVNTVSPNIGEFVRFREIVVPHVVFKDEVIASVMIPRLTRKFAAFRNNLIGRAYYADGNFNMADEYFTRALILDPTDRNSIHYKKKFRAAFGRSSGSTK